MEKQWPINSLSFFCKIMMIFCPSILAAQVQVKNEPNHKKVIENKYIRLLDVWITPGDTSLFHIHSTPSLFLHFTDTKVCVQKKGDDWITTRNEKGKATYTSFINDTLVHRVSNCDTTAFHVTDIELLQPYKPDNPIKPLPFPVIFENEKVIAYRLTSDSFDKRVIQNRGPMVAELVEGKEVKFHDAATKKTTRILNGKYLYINPGSSFYFTAEKDGEINLVVFEIK